MAATTTTPHSAPSARDSELHALAEQLYERISSGHDALEYNVDARGPALTIIGADGQRRPVPRTGGADAVVPAWQRARELREGGAAVDRRFNAWVLEKHLRGKYAVAPVSPSWVQWVALDIDAHPVPGAAEHVARRLAKEQADRVLANVWRALNCSAERHPLVQRSPGGGYHVWFPLTRGPTSANAEHTWPAAVARAWFERHLIAAGLELAPGVLEVFPSGRSLRAPCGSGMTVLQATRPSEPDALGLVPWPDTMAAAERVDWRGERAALSAPTRRVVPMVRAFLAQWDAQQRTMADWLGRPEATWDPTWAFLGWRLDTGAGDIGAMCEENSGALTVGVSTSSQQSDDVLGRPGVQGRRTREGASVRSGSRLVKAGSDPLSDPLLPDLDQSPAASDSDLPPDPAGGLGVRGRAFKVKVRRLLEHGITEPSTRHDAVLTLAFYWAATCGRSHDRALTLLEGWCKAHAHAGSRLGARPRMFVATCVAEAAHYLANHAANWKFRGQGDGGGLATLTSADQVVVTAADPRVRDEVAAILAWLAGRADDAGRIGAPIQIAIGLLARVCGEDRRVVEAGKRRRATTIAIEELERLGVLTLARNYVVGRRGREWSCWYQFGSGVLPSVVELPASAWAALARPTPRSTAPAATPHQPRQDAPGEAMVAVRVLGERIVPEGLLRVLSDGARGVPRTLLELSPEVAASPSASSSLGPVGSPVRPPWFVRMFQQRTFTPAELWEADAANVIPFPDLEARRRMTRRERLAHGTGELAPVIPLRASSASSIDPPSTGAAGAGGSATPAGPAAIDAREGALDDDRAELAEEVGSAATALPIDLMAVMAQAWRSFRRSRE